MSMIFRVHAQIFHARNFHTCLLHDACVILHVSNVLRTNFLRVRVVVPYGFAIRGKSATYGLRVSRFLRGFSGLPTCDMREYGCIRDKNGRMRDGTTGITEEYGGNRGHSPPVWPQVPVACDNTAECVPTPTTAHISAPARTRSAGLTDALRCHGPGKAISARAFPRRSLGASPRRGPLSSRCCLTTCRS